MRIEIGSTISHYRILRELGRGGMGVVYGAEDILLDRPVALKFLASEVLRYPGALERFQREAKSASALSHPNICTIYNVEETQDGSPFLVMEYLEGFTLRDRIRQGKMDIDELLDLAVQIADGLEAAHLKGIVHRDIKPANIFLTREGRAKILDFGLAKKVSPALGIDSAMSTATGERYLTEHGATVGTAAYMSPEQARGQELDARTDLFSFGAVIYEMAAGRNAFSGDTPALLFDSILNRTPEPIIRMDRALPRELDRIIGKALEKDRAQRFQSVSEMRSDLQRLRAAGSSAEAPVTESPVRTKSIAVLPFADMSAEKDQEYFCDGMAEELISALTKVEGLRVASRTSAFRFRGDTSGIAAQLQVDTLLEGSVRKSGNRLRITVRLVSVRDGFELWSQRYDRSIEDVFAIQDEIAVGVVQNLKARLGSGSLIQKHSMDIESYNLYLKGRYQWNRRTADALLKSIEYYRDAIERDPAYALAYSGLADSYGVLGYQEIVSPNEVMPKCRAAAKKALEIDESLAEAHAVLAYANMHYDWDWQAAEAGYRRALQLNPSYATAHHWYALHLAALGRFEESIAAMKRALELDPLSLIIQAVLGNVYYLARRHDDAKAQCARAFELDPRFSVAHYVLGLVSEQQGRFEDAIEEFQKAAAASLPWNMAMGCLGHAYARAGRNERALEIAEALKENARDRYVSFFSLGLIHAGLRENDRALSCFEDALEQHPSAMMYLKVDPRLDPLRGDPRFEELLRRTGLQS